MFNKTTVIIALLLVAVTLFAALSSRAFEAFSCFGQEYELGRETKYSFLFGTCIIDSGRKDTNGNVIWVRAENDRGFGE